jgi:hypothetical protein
VVTEPVLRQRYSRRGRSLLGQNCPDSGSDSDRGISDLAPVNPNGLTYFGTHLFGFSGCGVSGATESVACEGSESYSKTLIGGEFVQRLVSPHYPLVVRTSIFAMNTGRLR